VCASECLDRRWHRCPMCLPALRVETVDPPPATPAAPINRNPTGFDSDLTQARVDPLSRGTRVRTCSGAAHGNGHRRHAFGPLVNDIRASVPRPARALVSLSRRSAPMITYMHSVAVFALSWFHWAGRSGFPRGITAGGHCGVDDAIGRPATPLEVLNNPGNSGL